MTTNLIEIAVAEIKQLAVVEPKQASKNLSWLPTPWATSNW